MEKLLDAEESILKQIESGSENKNFGITHPTVMCDDAQPWALTKVQIEKT